MSKQDSQLKRHEQASQLERPPEYYQISRKRKFIRSLFGGYQAESSVVERIIIGHLRLNNLENSSTNRVLDLGCGSGKTLLSLKKHFEILVGIDFSPTFCAFAKTNIDQDNNGSNCLIIQNDVLDSLPFPDSYFDVLTMTQVLEHIEDVYWVMREARRVLRHGGLILLSVPNMAAVNRRLSLLTGSLPTTCIPRWRWPDEGWDGDHISYFTLEALKMLFNQTQFKFIGCKSSGYASRIRSIWPSLLSADLICYGITEK